MRTSPILPLVACCLALLAAPLVARAADVAEADALALKIEELRKAGDATLAETVAGVPEVYKAVEDKAARGKLSDALGKVLGDKDVGDARMAALTALVALEDPENAYREVGRFLPGVKVEEATELDVAIVKATGDLAQSKAIKPLQELMEKAKDNKLAREAAIALGGFGADKKNRVKILEEMVDFGKRLRPGQSTTKNVSKEASDRWAAVGGGIVAGLNRLTGQSLTSFELWESFVKDNKKNLQDVFKTGE